LLPVFRCDVGERFDWPDSARVVDGNVEPTEFAQGRRNKPFMRIGQTDVANGRIGLSAMTADFVAT